MIKPRIFGCCCSLMLPTKPFKTKIPKILYGGLRQKVWNAENCRCKSFRIRGKLLGML